MERISSNEQTQGKSLDVLWREFGSQFRRRARTRLRQYGLTGQTESMDICNDVMADLAGRNDGQPLNADDVLAYIMRAIDNQVLDTFRTLARHCRDFRRNDPTPVEDIKAVQKATSPSQVALRREMISQVRAALGSKDGVAIDMMLENRSWQEIGEAIGIQPDAARMRVRRALDRVREDFGISGEEV